MDIKKSISSFFGRRKPRNVSVSLEGYVCGNWTITEVTKFGFVLKNSKQKEEWHVCGESNGWITGLNKTNKTNPTVICVNTKGFPGYAPYLMDKASIAHRTMLLEQQLAKKPK